VYAIELEEVGKRFAGREAVRGVHLHVPTGSVYGLLGPNGAGKTTTLRLLLGILRPDTGRVTVLGTYAPETIRHRLAYLPEERGVYGRMRVLEFLVYLGRLRGLTRSEARRAARSMLERFDLAERSAERCESLSKGMTQKLQIIAALLHDPELIVLDEPFSGLDPVNVELVRKRVLELRDAGRTVIFSTHVMEQAERICDAVMLMHRGRVLLDGPLAEVRGSARSVVDIGYVGGQLPPHLPGVARINDAGRHAELTLAPDADPQRLLGALLEHVRVRRFEVREPSLHELFVRAVERA